MNPHQPEIETIEASEAETTWTHVIQRVANGRGRIVIEQDGVPVVAIVPVEDLRWLAQREATAAAGGSGPARADDALLSTQAAFRDVPDPEIEIEIARGLTAVRERARNGQW